MKLKSDAEYRKILTPEQYNITREKGTEAPFTGKYWDCKTPGIYNCICCGTALFSSETKYDSGTGWPSFYKPLAMDKIDTETDTSLGMIRTEALCSNCGSHLGHVFSDGPDPSGLRYCMNSASLNLKTKDSE
tara:strand:- start:3365 stop:3760 length:396 start_codon:yes stop_codon:yes gene_type:complete